MTELEIHPGARRAYDAQAVELLERIAQEPGPPPEADARWLASLMTGGTRIDSLSDPIVRMSQTDPDGREIGISAADKRRLVRIQGKDYDDLRVLSERFQGLPSWRDRISLTALIDSTVDWIRLRLSAESATDLTVFLIDNLAPRVVEHTIVIPIHELYVSRPFNLGRVRFESLSQDQLAAWQPSIADVDDSASQHTPIGRFARRAIGRAAARLALVAEPTRAFEIALRETELGLAMLRIHSKGVSFPEARSHCTVLGREAVGSTAHLTIRGSRAVALNEGFTRPGEHAWALDDSAIDEIMEVSLGRLHEILMSERRSQFEEDLLKALVQYSRCALAGSIEEKLIHVLVALEFVLLRNESEPIQANIAHRLAYSTTHDLQHRKELVKTVKAAYGLRSRWVHHGQSIKDISTSREFLRIAWVFFQLLVRLSDRFESRQQFLDHLEDMRMSGPPVWRQVLA